MHESHGSQSTKGSSSEEETRKKGEGGEDEEGKKASPKVRWLLFRRDKESAILSAQLKCCSLLVGELTNNPGEHLVRVRPRPEVVHGRPLILTLA